MNSKSVKADVVTEIEKAINNKMYLRWIIYADKLLKILNHEIAYTAEDIVHEVVIKLLDNSRQNKTEIDIDPLMKMNIRSVFSNVMKRQNRMIYHAPINDADYDIIENSEYEEFLNENFYNEYFEDPLCEKRIMTELTKTEQTILKNKLNGDNYDEIAKNMHIEKKEVYYHTRQIRRKIMKKYKIIFC